MRSWGKPEGEDGEPEAEEEKKDRLPKKKVAVLIGYNGIGYSGSQMFVNPFERMRNRFSSTHFDRNPGIKTVEGAVFQAMVDAGAISADNSTAPSKVRFDCRFRSTTTNHDALRSVSHAQQGRTQECTQLSTSSLSR